MCCSWLRWRRRVADADTDLPVEAFDNSRESPEDVDDKNKSKSRKRQVLYHWAIIPEKFILLSFRTFCVCFEVKLFGCD